MKYNKNLPHDLTHLERFNVFVFISMLIIYHHKHLYPFLYYYTMHVINCFIPNRYCVLVVVTLDIYLNFILSKCYTGKNWTRLLSTSNILAIVALWQQQNNKQTRRQRKNTHIRTAHKYNYHRQ